ncbi:MAG: UvrB/UvrC motif-containing protein [Candidatus Eisenbacteria sp.]|nr:UvrB/UvrC motif-containing protein [Candidatus Eisenbacteria bacterium]
MKCQLCGHADAVIHIKEVRNDAVTELHLCEKCAREKGFHSMLDQGKASLASQFIWMAENLYPEGSAKLSGVQCSDCGLHYSEFMRTGRLGCASCYVDFGAQLKHLLRRVHGSVRHVGKAPGKDGHLYERRQRVQKLHEDLQRAIEREEYERAAALRDEIRALDATRADSPSAAPSPGEGGGGEDGEA